MLITLASGLEWWHLLAAGAILVLEPVFRAISVVLLVKCVGKTIAKLALPYVLRPPRWRKQNDPHADPIRPEITKWK